MVAGKPFFSWHSEGYAAAIEALGAKNVDVDPEARNQGLGDGSIRGYENTLPYYHETVDRIPNSVMTLDVVFWPSIGVLFANPDKLAARPPLEHRTSANSVVNPLGCAHAKTMSEDREDRDLVNLPRPAWPNHEIGILWGDEDDLTIASGYRDAAEKLFHQWVDHGLNDGLLLPILYLYRHSIELSLKGLIRVSAQCAILDGYAGDENLSPNAVEEKVHTHNIKKLADRLDRYLGWLTRTGPINRIDPASWKLLRWLDSEDETGESFRYALVGKGSSSRPARPAYRAFNFYEQVNELHRIADLLAGGYSTWLHEYQRFQLEWLEYGHP